MKICMQCGKETINQIPICNRCGQEIYKEEWIDTKKELSML